MGITSKQKHSDEEALPTSLSLPLGLQIPGQTRVIWISQEYQEHSALCGSRRLGSMDEEHLDFKADPN